MPTEMKFRLRRADPDHLDITVFVGEQGQTLQNAGVLRLHSGEWQLFGACLWLGQQQMNGRFQTTTEGQAEALKAGDV